eukprot:CAMPEP_0174291020 /NCGR_PEP_ID=MMETSP0809-20121228/30821_1 /TAXON_ID=73025 ORGANISM="Eutreptiella gymnastica-like, Strain CCMP1594" /NCGR_SAMPLE_ID=MMETSP0809 /ASSEMBLY_ACC=CAM_ASM_000658 /LENGTH=79 /DNA_ID=CAMNT_0015390111 /DNA_START=166 /DNA_END=402 /DNA_ORIENTATION=-
MELRMRRAPSTSSNLQHAWMAALKSITSMTCLLSNANPSIPAPSPKGLAYGILQPGIQNAPAATPAVQQTLAAAAFLLG